jgi:hypothetical protein
MSEEQFWDNILQTIKQWRKQHPEHAPKLYLVQKKIESMQVLYMRNLQEYHYRNSKASLHRSKKIKQEADELFKKLSKFELLATLTK